MNNFNIFKNVRNAVLAAAMIVGAAMVVAIVVTTPRSTRAATGASCQTSQTNVWTSSEMPQQKGMVTVEFDAMANATVTDAVIGLSNEDAANYTDLGPIVRFSSASQAFDMRNGSIYTSTQKIPYIAGTMYHIKMVVNVQTHTYSAYVTPPGGTPQAIGTDYAFRTEQQSTPSLNYWTLFSDIQTATLCNWNITASVPPSSDTAAPSVPTGVFAGPVSNTKILVSWNPSTDNVGVAGYRVFQDGRLLGSVTQTSATVTGLVAPTSHTYTVAAFDAAGNVSAQSTGDLAQIPRGGFCQSN